MNDASNTNRICPSLGLSDDPHTSLAFPSIWNYCHRCKPIASVTLDHQENCCLTGNYKACPVFLQAPNVALPHGLRNVKLARPGKKKAFWKVIFVIPALLAVMFIFGWNFLVRGTPFPNLVFLATSAPAIPSLSASPALLPVIITPSLEQLIAVPLLPTASPVTFTPSLLPNPSSTLSNAYGPGVTLTNTRIPHGIDDWIGVNYIFRIYRAEPGLSLESLASVYNTTAAAVVAVNYRLSTPLVPGQLIVIPINQKDVSNLPQFEIYHVEENTTINNLASKLNVDPDQLRYFNGLPISEQQLIAKEWIIVPRERPEIQ